MANTIPSLMDKLKSSIEKHQISKHKLYETIHYAKKVNPFFSTTSIKTFGQSDAMIKILHEVHHRLHQCENENDQNKQLEIIKDTMIYLKLILKNTNDPYGELYFPPKGTLSKTELNELENVYRALLFYYYNQPWHFSYPLDNNNEVSNATISEWQNSMAILSNNPNKAMVDFTRSYTVDGKTGRDVSEAVIKQRIEALVHKTSYDEKTKTALATWLRANGGQDNNRFLDFLILSGEFNDKESFSPGKTVGKIENWSVKNGKIHFSYAADVITLTTPDAVLRMQDGKPFFDPDIDPKKLINAQPLMSVTTEIELNVVNGIVKPSIIKLNITSYAGNALQSPARLYNINKENVQAQSPKP